jgi:hypothetical protein
LIFERQSKELGISKKILAAYWYRLAQKRVEEIVEAAKEKEKEKEREKEEKAKGKGTPSKREEKKAAFRVPRNVDPIVELSFPWLASKYLNKLLRHLNK